MWDAVERPNVAVRTVLMHRRVNRRPGLTTYRRPTSTSVIPNEILAVPSVPRTLTGKKLEVPIKKLLLGQPLEKVVTRDALANPASLDWYVQFAAMRSARPTQA